MRALVIPMLLSAAGLVASDKTEVRVHPSGDELAENVLRLSVSFPTASAPGVLERIALRTADGTAIDQPFLQQELWSPDGKTLTLLLHPGRVKSGLRAQHKAGRALHSGDRVTLLLDGGALKTWRVGPARTQAPDPERWSVQPPRSGTRDAVVVSLDAPIDAQAIDSLVIVSPRGEKVKGRATLAPGEQDWRLTPEAPWTEGTYRILIHPRLEDPQGNALRDRFEQKAGTRPRDATTPAELPLIIGGT
jgi:hypothetical protein